MQMSISPPDLSPLTAQLAADFSLTAHLAAELEFYLHGAATHGDMTGVLAAIHAACTAAGVSVYHLEKERGGEQYEIALHPAAPEQAARDAVTAKNIITDMATRHGLQADFSAKPQADQPGSGLHIHLHLADTAGQNIFIRDAEDNYSEPLLYTVGGLLATMQEFMPVFAATPAARARLLAGGDHIPTTVSWGPNNRTVAVRLPSKPRDNKHIEHRVAGADADIAMVMAAILHGAHYGLTHRPDPGPPIHGDASLGFYGAVRLCVD